MYEVAEVAAGLRLPGVKFVAHTEKSLHAILAATLLFYLELWAINMNFLVLFYRLGAGIQSYCIF